MDILNDGIGSVEIINSMGGDVDVVNAARVSFGKRKDLMDKDDEVLINYLVKHNHTSPFEHVAFTFHVKCPLFIRSQWMRHRTWSYNEISRRYTTENIEFFIPNEFRYQDTKKNLQGSDGGLHESEAAVIRRQIEFHQNHSMGLYEEMLDRGVANEQARLVLPQSMYTEFYATVNLHNLAHFLRLRADSHAQLEMQEYANGIIELIQPIVPITGKALLKYKR